VSDVRLEEGANLVGVFLEQPQSRIHRTIQISHIADQRSINAVVLDIIPASHPPERYAANQTNTSELPSWNFCRSLWLDEKEGRRYCCVLRPGFETLGWAYSDGQF
jgi:hypothetical protein